MASKLLIYGFDRALFYIYNDLFLQNQVFLSLTLKTRFRPKHSEQNLKIFSHLPLSNPQIKMLTTYYVSSRLIYD